MMRQRIRKSMCWLTGLALCAAALSVSTASAQSARPDDAGTAGSGRTAVPGRPLPNEGAGQLGIAPQVSSAPGYCTSQGGSLLYEEIQDTEFTRLPNGLLQVDVTIHLDNPTNCQPGDACPEYMNFPERLSVWVDWDKNHTWNNTNEWVIVNREEWYLDNYADMLYSTVVPVPGTLSGTTWVRVALGWGYQPTNPCVLHWVWGDVKDYPLDLGSVSNPFDTMDITVKGRFDDSKDHGPTFNEKPQTGAFADYRAEMTLKPNVTVQSCLWRPVGYDRSAGVLAGVVTPGTGNQVTCTASRIPESRTIADITVVPYGERKVELEVSYSVGGIAARPVIIPHEFELYFGKWEDDSQQRKPNWFIWWGVDGAAFGLTSHYLFDVTDLEYDSVDGDSKVTLTDQWGSIRGQYHTNGQGTGAIEMMLGSALQSDAPNFPLCSFDAGAAAGLASFATTLRHEELHRGVDYRFSVGSWVPQPPTVVHDDSDKLPNAYEAQLNGSDIQPGYTDSFTRVATTDPTNADSCNLAGETGEPYYAVIGDQELDARVASQTLRQFVDSRDWANPGTRSGWTSGDDPDADRW